MSEVPTSGSTADEGIERKWTLKTVLQWSKEYLSKYGSESPRLDAELLLSQVLACERIDLYVHFDKPLNGNESQTLRELLYRRACGEPMAYLLGSKEFWNKTFKVGPGVLVPRPESELIIEWCLKSLSEQSPQKILDIGTGTGILAITLASIYSQAQVDAWDTSELARRCTAENAQQLQGARINISDCDALDDSNYLVGANYDLIVTNPPYIATSRIKDLSKEVSYEPRAALDGGYDGLCFYRHFSDHIVKILKPGGYFLAEIGFDQESAVRSLFTKSCYQDFQIMYDLAGLPRMLKVRRSFDL